MAGARTVVKADVSAALGSESSFSPSREYQVPSSVILFTLLARVCRGKASIKRQRTLSAHGGACDKLCSSNPWWLLGQGFTVCGFTSSSAHYSVYQVQGSTYIIYSISADR